MEETENIKAITVVEFIVTYVSLGWAVVLLSNNDTFSQSNNFNRIEVIVKYEWLLGLICLGLAAFKIVGLVLRNYRMRKYGLLASGVFWTLMSAGFLMSSGVIEFNTGFVVYSALAILCIWSSKEVKLIGVAYE